ncbi:hypothetical protein I7I53_03959 [Histoplasma capsulatum var. duboisii H88]|uniref:Uncharacterized protein n=1 Tax=Ajellomyces capsulatus (strain H88) TaxID=544711 RepID=A0A8A1LU33_AJEC8|nr:hypothetical protein I7I53_03959 [Histoplasma capsulatum var. duboisii H88]
MIYQTTKLSSTRRKRNENRKRSYEDRQRTERDRKGRETNRQRSESSSKLVMIYSLGLWKLVHCPALQEERSQCPKGNTVQQGFVCSQTV